MAWVTDISAWAIIMLSGKTVDLQNSGWNYIAVYLSKTSEKKNNSRVNLTAEYAILNQAVSYNVFVAMKDVDASPTLD